ncbi:hypothetical protein BH09VER1_BH09VER1_51620 [soil metagenome]
MIFAACLIVKGAPVQAQYVELHGTAEQEIRRLEMMNDYAQKQVNKGMEAMISKDFESAFAYYKSSVDTLPSGGIKTKALRETALDGFSRATVELAKQRVSEGRTQDAVSTVNVVLGEHYNPNYAPALELKRSLLDPASPSRTLTPAFIANVEEVKQLLLEADGFYASGRFDLAFKRYEQVLNIDKYNIAARRGMEKVNLARQHYAENAYNDSRGDMLRQVDKGWEMPVRHFDVGAATIIEQPQIDTRGTSLINRKLDEIVLPRIDFHDATVREAIDFIKQRAVALDTTEQDPARKGVNILLKLRPEAPEANARITLSLNDIPLRAAIEYVAKAANLKLKVEQFAVAIVPVTEVTDVLITKQYKVPPGFITSLPAASTGSALPGAGGPTVAAGSLSSVAARSNAKDFLLANGIEFPTGASANFIASSSKLIVKNTQANLDLIDTLVDTQTQTPSQVEIESKFLEVTQNNLKEMGFDWLLGQFSLAGGSGVYGGGGTSGFGTSINSNSFPFISAGSTTPVGASSSTSGPVTSGNRSGSTAITANAVDALLYGSPAGPAAGILALAGVFTNPQFQVVLRALNQQKGVDLVSAPKVTTKSGQRATVQIVREFRYPSEFDLPQVTQTPGSIYTPAAPTTPTAFEMKPVGITLEVEPTVGPDGYTIDLVLSPKVVEFDGFINYGSPINTVVTVVGYSISSSFRVTDNVINQPVFSTREVTTEVTCYDGQTVVLGGLMREDIQKTQDKVPILGDIPIAGRLFRTTADQHVKRNLIMFVTANLLDPAGQPLVKSDDESDIVASPSGKALKQEIIPGDATSVQPRQ